MIASGLVDFALRDAPGNWRLMVAALSFRVRQCMLVDIASARIPEMVGHPRGRLPDALEVIHGLREGPKGMEMLGGLSKHGAGGSGAHGPVERRRRAADDRARTDPNAETPGGGATRPPSRAPSRPHAF